MIDLFGLRGTGEAFSPVPSGMIGQFVRLLDPRFNPISVQYPATIGPVGGGPLGPSLDSAVRIAADNLAAAIRRTPNKAGVVTYSLGGLGANLLLEEMAAGKHRDLEISFVVNIANPGRREGESLGNVATGFGLHGQRRLGPAHIPVFEVANPRDMITAAAADSPVRRISDAISPFSFIEGGRLGSAYLYGQLSKMENREQYWQFWNPRFRERYREAFDDVAGYGLPYPWGFHVSYASQLLPGAGVPYLAAAADLLNRTDW